MLQHIRLMPIVIVACGALLLVKGWGLAEEARAQSGPTAPAAAPHPPSAVTAPDPAADDSTTASPAAVDVLTSLGKRRAALDARERDLTMRSNMIDAATQRVDARIAELKALQANLQTMMGLRDTAEQKQLDAIVKSYSSMKPADAARIFNSLSDDVLVPIAAAMKPDVLGAVLAKMQADAAQKLTVKLANRLKVTVPMPAPVQQVAAANPPPATPSAQAPATNAPAAASTAAATAETTAPSTASASVPSQPQPTAATAPSPNPAAPKAGQGK
jgi:flagellar motility protein MotE (MotC chaperone)